MRTTVDLDPDVVAALRRRARERGSSLKDVMNATLRAGLGQEHAERARYVVPARPLGLRAGVDLTRALALAAELEDEEIVRKLELRK